MPLYTIMTRKPMDIKCGRFTRPYLLSIIYFSTMAIQNFNIYGAWRIFAICDGEVG